MTHYVSQCPNCDTSFKVSDSQLAAADGAVRCGACLQVFVASDYFVEAPIPDLFEEEHSEDAPKSPDADDADNSKEPDLDQTGTEESSIEEADVLETDVVDPVVDPVGETDVVETEEVDPDEVDPDEVDTDVVKTAETTGQENSLAGDDEITERSIAEEDVVSTTSEDEVNKQQDDSVGPLETGDEELVSAVIDQDINHQPEAPSPEQVSENLELVKETYVDELEGEYVAPKMAKSRRRWIVASFFVGLLLVTQYFWFEREALSVNPKFRSYYLMVCNAVGCALPEYSDPATLYTTDLVVRSHPSTEGGLVVDAILRNESPYRQKFPVLQLRFSNINGKTIAQREFSPDTYLAGELAGLQYIPAVTEVRLSLDIVDPGSQAVSYAMRTVLD